MPIKFRCSYCRQFLGISRNRGGEIVDCPTCGRSIRVPGLDGVVVPLPGPELNGEDSHLIRALDELAALAEAPALRPVLVNNAEVSEDAEIPQALPEPEPVELPMPVRVAPVSVVFPVPPADAAAAMPGETRASLDALLQPLPPASEAAFSVQHSEQKPLTSSILFVVVLPLTTLVLGWMMGSSGRYSRNITSLTTPLQSIPVDAVVVESAEGLEGRITYRTAEGEVRPDVGALVVAIPETWTGQLRLAPTGLRPGDADVDQAAALTMAAALGGGAVRADAAGRYQLRLPSPGRYTVVIISRFAERTAEASIPPDDVTRLQTFLADPVATIGNRAVDLDTVTTTTDQITPRDHTFR